MVSYSDAHICQCLSRLATLRRNSTITVTGDRRLTGEQFVECVLGLARGLLDLGLASGDTVAISALNRDWYLEWLLAVTFAGGIAVPLNYRWSFKEVKSAMDDVRPVMLVTDESCSHWFPELHNNTIPSLRWHASMSDFNRTGNVLTTESLQKSSLRLQSFNYFWAPEGVALISFTSGTTGRPKGVTISHSALIVQSLAKIAIVGYGEDDVYLHTAPLCHIGGISSAMAMLMVGGCHVMLPKFEAKLALDAIEQHHVTSLITVPAIMTDLVSIARAKKSWKGKENVKKILNGGGSLSTQLIKEATKLFPRAKLLSAYGTTEACSSLTFMTLYDPTLENFDQHLQVVDEIKPDSVQWSEGVCVGKPAPHVELRISNEKPYHAGKILTRGSHVMLRYWCQVLSMTSNSHDEGWLDTGDTGKIDDYGNLWLIGRTNGRIKSGGENVYPEEVEAVLSQHPGISGIVVFGAPDTRLTEMVVACFHMKDNWQWVDSRSNSSGTSKELCLSSEILHQYCKEKNLTGFKIPKKFIVWTKPFPFTETGKLRRDQVKREVTSYLKSLPSNL